jgi:hypothetical protein
MRPGCSTPPTTLAATGEMMRHVFTIHTSYIHFSFLFHTILGLLKEGGSSAEVIQN